MDRIRIKSCLLAVLLALPLSCSIKEDRTACPCLLTVDLSRTLDAGITPPSQWDKGLCIVLFQNHNRFFIERHSLSDAQAEYDYRVEKGDVGVTGILGLDGGVFSGSEIRYREGCESDRLYVSSRMVPCYGETARTTLEMYKQFSNVEITGLESFDYRMEVTAGCDGLDVLERRALEGSFRFILRCDGDGVCRFRMPRQDKDDLRILLWDASGQLDNAIPLGAYLTAIGYDWHAPSLSDVSVHVDFVTAAISITVGDWTQVVEFPYTL